MSRAPTLSDDEIVARARPVFVDRGYAAHTRQIAAAVGLSWGAIALRFGTKRALFDHAMAGPSQAPDAAGCENAEGDLPWLLQRLRAHVWECWPLRLQVRLAPAAWTPAEQTDVLAQRVAAVLATQAARGVVRSDVSSDSLAQMVLALVTGDVARRFVAHEHLLQDDLSFIDGVVCLLSAT
ncbi:MAG TPA: helix-turn-helix domain-containing protein [Albitalea sp.]|nr:helix-turn-helix domain-containing protein [Albitalea sp.]